MSLVLSGFNCLLSGLGYCCKLLGIAEAVKDSIDAKNNTEISTTQKAAIIGSNGVYIVAQVIDMGGDLVKFDSDRLIKLDAESLKRPLSPLMLEARDRALLEGRLLRELNKDRFVHIMPGQDAMSRAGNSLVEFGENTLRSFRRGIIDHPNVHISIKGTTAIADIARVSVKKIFKFQRHGLTFDDYLQCLQIICFRSHEMQQYIPDIAPEFYAANSNKLIVCSDITQSCHLILGNREKLAKLGEFVLKKIHLRRDSQPVLENRLPSGEESLSSEESLGINEEGSFKAEIMDSSTSTEYSESSEMEIQPMKIEDSIEKSSPLEAGEIITHELLEITKINDINRLEKIPSILSTNAVLKKYQCAISKMNGDPKLIRFIMMIRGGVKDPAVFYERNEIYRWFEEHPTERPPNWPLNLEYSRAILEDFNQSNIEKDSIQNEIDTILQAFIEDFQANAISILNKFS